MRQVRAVMAMVVLGVCSLAAGGCVFDNIHEELTIVNGRLATVEQQLDEVKATNAGLLETNEQLVQLQDKLKTLDSIDASLKGLDGHLASLRKTLDNIDSTIPFLSFSSDSEVPPALDFTMESITGDEINLAGEYGGKIVLIVNVASQCGFTPQYEGLQALYDKYAEQGFVVLGFPANNFRNQEPGTNEQIMKFCEENYNVTFPMFAKISVRGEDIAPLYAYLTDPDEAAASQGALDWNFEKFLLDRDGNVVKHYRSRITPEEFEADIVALLEQ